MKNVITQYTAPTANTARSLAQALSADPFYRSVTVACGADEAARAEMLAGYFELALIEGRLAGRVDLTADGASGAAIWSTNSDAAVRAGAYATRERALAGLLGDAGFANFQAIVTNMEAHLAPYELGSAWYLSIAGIAPQAQGGGLGASLLAGGLAAVDDAGAVCFLETFNQRSLPFYARLGFAETARLVEPLTGCAYWLMVRPAQPRQA